MQVSGLFESFTDLISSVRAPADFLSMSNSSLFSSLVVLPKFLRFETEEDSVKTGDARSRVTSKAGDFPSRCRWVGDLHY